MAFVLVLRHTEMERKQCSWMTPLPAPWAPDFTLTNSVRQEQPPPLQQITVGNTAGAAAQQHHFKNTIATSEKTLCSTAAKLAADWKLPWNIFSGGWFLAGMWRSRGAFWQCGTTKPPLPLSYLNPAPSPSCCPGYISAGHFRDPVQY